MQVGFLLLADHSESVNGKLYMVGGGWNVLRLPELPHDWGFHIALGLDVGWDETNNHHDLLVNVHDPDGNELGEGLAAEFEAGRPPGMPAGQEQRLVMSIGTSGNLHDRRSSCRGGAGQRRGDRPRPLLRDRRRAGGPGIRPRLSAS